MGDGLTRYRDNVRILALAILGGSWEKKALTDRLEQSLDGGPPDPARLASRLMFHFDAGMPPSRQRLIEFLHNEDELHRHLAGRGDKQRPNILLEPAVMGTPPDNLLTFPLPPLPTVKDLCEWLGVFRYELDWFADIERRQCRVAHSKLHHYSYRWIEKRCGSPRLIEIPKTRLKTIQRRIAREILNRVPPHTCSHGFTRGRSCRSFVEPHLKKPVVLRMDLKDFFHRVPVARVGALFRRLGYPWSVARLLQGVCCHTSSPSLAGNHFQALTWEQRKRLLDKHLPQGAPTSPAIANLCTWRFDNRLHGVANRFALDYTRYADDLALSGGMELLRLAPFLQRVIGAIALEEGFDINHRKTRVRSQARSQRLAGMVINRKPNLPRAEFDRLKAILYNCARWGAESQNRQGVGDFRAHLAGRIAHVAWLNPARAAQLERLFAAIQWSDESQH